MEGFPLKEQERGEKGLKIAQAFPLPLDPPVCKQEAWKDW